MTERQSDEPINLVLEHLRAFRAEMSAQLSDIRSQLDEVRADMKSVKASIRGFQHQTIAEIYKANLTVSAFADLDRRVSQLEAKAGIAPQ